MAELLQVELVAADRVVWSGEAHSVIARTTEGDIGILLDHAPILSLLIEGVVEVRTEADELMVAAVDAGFLSVAQNRVSILAEDAQMSTEIDVEQARQQAEKARSEGDEDDATEAARRAEARIRAVERAS
jgi:F-type H+-transporting ATPase subunit epsilon